MCKQAHYGKGIIHDKLATFPRGSRPGDSGHYFAKVNACVARSCVVDLRTQVSHSRRAAQSRFSSADWLIRGTRLPQQQQQQQRSAAAAGAALCSSKAINYLPCHMILLYIIRSQQSHICSKDHNSICFLNRGVSIYTGALLSSGVLQQQQQRWRTPWTV